MRIRPMNDRVIVKRMEQEKKTAGGIIIPDTAWCRCWKKWRGRANRF